MPFCRMLLLLLWLLPAGLQGATTTHPLQQADEEGSRAEFDRMQHDFGRIDRSRHTAEFRLTNTGTAPLVIVRTETSCHCIALTCPAEPLRPGETRTVTVSYTPDRRTEGTFSQYIRLYTNARTKAPVMLFLRGEVVR